MNTPPKKPKSDVSHESADIGQKSADFAQKSVDRAQAAFERVSDVAHSNVQTFDAAASAFKSRAADLQMKTMEIAQANMNAAFAFARRAVTVKDPAEFTQLSQDFAREQFQAFTRQASEFNELALLLSRETVKPVQDNMVKSFGDFSKSFAA